MTTDIGIPEALKMLSHLYERLEAIRIDLGKFVSYEDEGNKWENSESLLGTLHQSLGRTSDTVSSIRCKVDTLLEDEPK